MIHETIEVGTSAFCLPSNKTNSDLPKTNKKLINFFKSPIDSSNKETKESTNSLKSLETRSNSLPTTEKKFPKLNSKYNLKKKDDLKDLSYKNNNLFNTKSLDNDSKCHLYLRNSSFADSLKNMNKELTSNDLNRRVAFGNETDFKEKKDLNLPKSMLDLLNRSATARNTVSEPLTKNKKKFDSNNLDLSASKNKALTLASSNYNKNRSDFARNYALNAKTSSSTLALKNNEANCSNTLANLNNLSNITNKTTGSKNILTNSSIQRRPRSDYANNKRLLLKRKDIENQFENLSDKVKDKRSIIKKKLVFDDDKSAYLLNKDLHKSSLIDLNINSEKKIKKQKGILKKNQSIDSGLTSSFLKENEKINQNLTEMKAKLLNKKDEIDSIKKTLISQRRDIYKQKGTIKLSIGIQGTKYGQFTWPKDVCFAEFKENNSTTKKLILVADSSNNRCQVFDLNGKFQFLFGNVGSIEGKLDCPTSICCLNDNRIVISDSNNHRLQWFDSKGNFLFSSFDNKHETNNNLSYPYGICFESTCNEIYICDKENQRVQIVDLNGKFKRFLETTSTEKNNQLLLECPYFIHANNQKVIISDTNNHIVYIVSLKNSRKLISLGGKGSCEGKFKFPRGVALDEQGFAIVADSGNNRIQIFNPDGTFLKSFGSWGSKNGQFKSIEGISIDDSGNIYVCDRENHRVQIF